MSISIFNYKPEIHVVYIQAPRHRLSLVAVASSKLSPSSLFDLNP